MPANDFNGDGRSDILWQHANGTISTWLARPDGGFIINDGEALRPGLSLSHVYGAGDFDGDGNADILWSDLLSPLRMPGDIENFSVWSGNDNGAFDVADQRSFVQPMSGLYAYGVGDFNGDGVDDIIWRSDGWIEDTEVWFGTRQGSFLKGETTYPWSLFNWVAGVGDFNGDGRDDVLNRTYWGTISYYPASLEGEFPSTVMISTASIPVPSGWDIVGIGDFNGDGRDDLLWRHQNGLLSDWLALPNGQFMINDSAALVNVSTDWVVVATGDYNGDGRDDILWRNRVNGDVSNWLAKADGAFDVNDAAAYMHAPIDWAIQPLFADPFYHSPY